MATAEQLKSLIRSHLSDDSERFFTVALQVAAHESMQGHGALAHDIRAMVEASRRAAGPNALLKFPQDLGGLVHTEQPSTRLPSLVVPPDLAERIERIILEYRQQDKLKSHGLTPRRKLLLTGPPGTGKTMTARVLARELSLPLHTIQVDKLVTKFMGETAAKLRQIFDLIRDTVGVYFFDEFDAIAADRGKENDVGEMRRVLNAFLQFIEQDNSDSLIIGATNNPALLDRALFRRFDDVIHYGPPDVHARRRMVQNLCAAYLSSKTKWTEIIKESEGLSHAEIDQACRDAIKAAVLQDQARIKVSILVKFFREKQAKHLG